MTHAEAFDTIVFLTQKGFRIAAIVQLLRDRDQRSWSYHKTQRMGGAIQYVIACNGTVVWTDERSYDTFNKQRADTTLPTPSPSTGKTYIVHRDKGSY